MRLHKIEIARRQIEVALDLHFNGSDPLAVITLAGAAEEILGSLLKRYSKHAAIHRVLARMERESGETQDFAEFSKNINRVRNALKHARDPGEDEIDIPPQEPISMLGRAVGNYVMLKQPLSPSMIRLYPLLKAAASDAPATSQVSRAK